MTDDQREIVERPVRFGTAELLPDPVRPRGWTVCVDGVAQSYVDIDEPRWLRLPYPSWLAELIDRHWPAGAPISAIHLGGAGCTLPRYVAATRPGSAQTVFELDGDLVELVRAHLDLDAVPGLDVQVRDGGAGIRAAAAGSADLVVLDVFRAGSAVTDLATVEFLGALAPVLRAGGLYAANIWDAGELTFARRAVAAVAEVFPHVVILANPRVLLGRLPGNVVVGAATEPFPVDELRARGESAPHRFSCLTARQLAAWRGAVPPITGADQATDEVPDVLRWGRGSRFA